jgi:FkbM family methyltransferase
MELLEKVAATVRHNALLRRADWLWDKVRPLYNRTIETVSQEGLARNMNGADPMVLSPRLRNYPEVYEPDIWPLLMSEIKAGDTFADVGTCYGLYSIAVGRRVGAGGKVFAFEPDGNNFSLAEENVRLNNLQRIIDLRRAAVSDTAGVVHFAAGRSTESHIAADAGPGTVAVDCVTLDGVFAGRRVDVLKIDVEGYEEPVLRGARQLLSDASRAPRVIFLEVHPFAWAELGTTGAVLLQILAECGYAVFELDGRPVTQIDAYGEVVARRISRQQAVSGRQ